MAYTDDFHIRVVLGEAQPNRMLAAGIVAVSDQNTVPDLDRLWFGRDRLRGEQVVLFREAQVQARGLGTAFETLWKVSVRLMQTI